MASRLSARLTASAALVAGAALMAPMAAIGAAENQKVPPRHVICQKVQTWIPLGYSGGCYLSFSPAIRSSAYAAFAKAGANSSQWAGANAAAAVKAMRCTRGGVVNTMRLNRWQSGTCVWNETYQHVGYGDHGDHQWQCEVTMVVTSAPNGKMRGKGTRMAMQWLVSSTPLQDLTRTDGEFPFCDKSVPEDAWQ
jgi:hypothetical protein